MAKTPPLSKIQLPPTNSLSWVYFYKGRYPRAISVFLGCYPRRPSLWGSVAGLRRYPFDQVLPVTLNVVVFMRDPQKLGDCDALEGQGGRVVLASAHCVRDFSEQLLARRDNLNHLDETISIE